jgi:hypothetical protein
VFYLLLLPPSTLNNYIMKQTFLLFLFFTGIINTAIAQQNQINKIVSTVNIIGAPAGSIAPDVVMDAGGVLHEVYAANNNAYYIRSYDNGASYTAPVQINTSIQVEFNMGERGPRLSVGFDGVIHVAWMDKWSVGVHTYARYARSTDGGLTFSPPVAVSATWGIDGVSVAADGNGHVLVFWHTNVPAQSTIPEATWLHVAASQNNGASFGADTNVVITNLSALACSMCMTRARFGAGSNVYVAFRSAENNIRDFYVLKGNGTNNNYTAIRVNTDNWNINFCPMVGPELEVASGGRQVCAFMYNYNCYWAVSDSATTAFSLHVATPASEVDERYPTAIANNVGKVLFVWQVGPLSTIDSATVKWALYNIDGTYTGQQGTVGRTSSGTKATAFVGTDDNFYIVANVSGITSSIKQCGTDDNISVYPNPACDNINVIAGVAKQLLIWIYNMEGKLMESIVADKENTKIDISGLAEGACLLKVETEKRIEVKRFIKE